MPDVVGELNIVIDSARTADPGSISEAAYSLETLKESIKGMPVTQLKKLGDALKEFKVGEGVKSSLTSITDFAQAVGGLNKSTGRSLSTKISNINDALKGFGTQEQLKEASANIDIFSKSLDSLGTAIKGVRSSVKTSKKTLMGTDPKQIKNSTSQAMKFGAFLKKGILAPFRNIRKSIKSIGTLLKPIMRLARTMAIRAAIRAVVAGIREGTQNLVRFSQATNNSDISKAAQTMNGYATAFTYLKNSIGAAAMPILNVLLPAFKMLAGWIATAFNYLNMFVEALKGNTMYTAAKMTEVDYAASLDKANGSAKKLKKTLLGFDEINILNGKDNGGGGGGSADAFNIQDAFENRQIDSSVKDFAEKIKQIIVDSGIVDAFERVKTAWDTFQNYEWVKQLKALIGKVTASVFKDSVEAVRDVLNLISALLEGNWKDSSIYALGLLLQSVFNPLFTIMQFVAPLLDKIHGTNTSDTFDKLADVDWTNVVKSVTEILDTLKDIGRLLGVEFLKDLFPRIRLFVWNLGITLGELVVAAVDKIADIIRAIGKALSKFPATKSLGEGLINLADGLSESTDKLSRKLAFSREQFEIYKRAITVPKKLTNLFGKEALVSAASLDTYKASINKAKASVAKMGDAIAGTRKTAKKGGIQVDFKTSGYKTTTDDIKNIAERFHERTKMNTFEVQVKFISGGLNNLKADLNTVVGWVNKLGGTHIKIGVNSKGDAIALGLYNKQGTQIQQITPYASGGFPSIGEVYIARENGSEMVGRIGNSSAVANNDQIVEAVSRGVASAVRSVLGNGSNGGQATNIYVDGEKLFNVMVNRNNETVRTTGASPLMV